MNRLLTTVLAIALLVAGMPAGLRAQNQGQRQTTPPEVEAERMRIQAEQRERQAIEQRDWETRIFPIRYVDPVQLSAALAMFRASMQANQDLRVLSVRAPKEIMPAIEDAIKRLDVPAPRRDAELTAFVLLATDQNVSATALPPSLQPVITQLRSVLSYKGYELVDTLIARSTGRRGAPAQLMGTLSLGSVQASYTFQARFQVENPDGKAPVLRLNDMSFRLRVPNPTNLPGPEAPVAITADVEIPQGQQVIVGKATMGDRALILVMTAKFPN